MDDKRFSEIDRRVEESGHRFNPNTGRFDATVGSDVENNLDLDPTSFLARMGELAKDDDAVTDEEFIDYVARKRREYDDNPGDRS